MALLEDVSESGLAWPLGLGLVVAAVSAGPQLVKSGRPLLKRAIKGYLTLQEKSKEMFAETGERMQDIYAEAKHEYDEEAQCMKSEAEEKPHHEEPRAEGAKPVRRTRKAESEAA